MRTLGVVRLGLGGLLLICPSVGPWVTRTSPTRRVLLLSRVLGLRYLSQGTLDLTLRPDRRIDVAIESLHALSMLPLARPGRPHAPLALLSAGVATLLAVATSIERVDGAIRPGDAPGHGRRLRTANAARYRVT